jgi:integration host factor subunit alpha
MYVHPILNRFNSELASEMVLKKVDLVEHLHEQIGLNKQEAKMLVNLFFETLASSLAGGEEIKLQTFGHFKLLDKQPRVGRNPKTGMPYMISPRRVVTFRASKRIQQIFTPPIMHDCIANDK